MRRNKSKNKITKIKIVIAMLVIVLAIFLIIKGMNSNGRDYKIEKVENYNYFTLEQNDKYGVIDKDSNIVIEPQYEGIIIPNPSKGIFVCKTENNETKIYNEKNEEKFSNYEEVSAIRLKNVVSDLMYEKSVLKYKKDGKYGLIDFTGKELTKAIYGKIESLEYKEGELLVEKDGKYGVININGNEMIPFQYETIMVDEYSIEENDYSKAGYIVGTKTEEGYRYGYIDVNGNEILKPEYNEISRIIDIKDDNNKYLLASKNGQYGVYKNEKQIINNEYQSINYNKTNNIFVLEKSKKYGIANIDGNNITDIKYAQIDISGKYLYVKEKGKETEVIDAKGQKVEMDANISKDSVADGKYTIVITTGKSQTMYGVQDEQGKDIIESKYSYIEYLFDNYFIVCNTDGKLGIVDDKGNVKAELKYSSIQKIGDNKLVQVSISNEKLTGIYSEKMQEVAEMKNGIITKIGDYVRIYNDTESVYLTKQGEVVKNKQVYENNKLFAVNKDGKWGFEDKNGNIKVECKYDKVTEFNEFGYAGIKQDGKWGVMDKEGKIILNPTYKFENNIEPEFLGKYYKITYGFGEIYYTDKV